VCIALIPPRYQNLPTNKESSTLKQIENAQTGEQMRSRIYVYSGMYGQQGGKNLNLEMTEIIQLENDIK
jgi:hypothetical protein